MEECALEDRLLQAQGARETCTQELEVTPRASVSEPPPSDTRPSGLPRAPQAPDRLSRKGLLGPEPGLASCGWCHHIMTSIIY